MFGRIKSSIAKFIKTKVVMVGYYGDLANRMTSYKSRFPDNPRRCATRLIWWNFKSLFKKHVGYSNDSKPQRNDSATNASTSLSNISGVELSNKDVNIGFLIRGGLGDFLVHANYIHHFVQKFQNDLLQVDIYVRSGMASAHAVFGKVYPVEVRGVYLENGNQNNFENYDLFIDLSRYPDIKHRRGGRLSELMPELLEYVFLCERFKEENRRFFSHSGITDGQAARLESLKNRKRIQQPDIYGYFGITESYDFPLRILEDEKGYLESLGLYRRPFITLHRGCDAKYTQDSVKLWPTAHYDILIRLLKKRFPDLTLIQIGVSHDRCPAMEGIDINLVGGTSLEQVKILLKYATVHIDGEGGMVHLRHAINGGPSVVMFGPTSSEFFGYSENVNLVGDGCPSWCEWTVHHWQDECIRGQKIAPCMRSILPEMVFEKVVALYEMGDKTNG